MAKPASFAILALFNRPQPEFIDQYGIGRDLAWDTFVPVGEMRTYSYLPVSATFHPDQGMFNACDEITLTKASLGHLAIPYLFATVQGPFRLEFHEVSLGGGQTIALNVLDYLDS